MRPGAACGAERKLSAAGKQITKDDLIMPGAKRRGSGQILGFLDCCDTGLLSRELIPSDYSSCDSHMRNKTSSIVQKSHRGLEVRTNPPLTVLLQLAALFPDDRVFFRILQIYSVTELDPA